MYFSISEVKNDRAAQLAVMTANALGECMLAGEQNHVAFEAAIASVNRKTGIDTALVAAQLLAQDADYRKKAIRVGMKGIVDILGGEDAAKQFFQQVSRPWATLRFESVGGVRDDIHSAKSRGALLAMRAAFGRKLQPEAQGQMPAEREYVEFVKSVYRTLDVATDNHEITAGFANDVANEINAAGHVDLDAAMKPLVQQLQQEAAKEVAQESRQRLMARYKEAKPDHNGPALH